MLLGTAAAALHIRISHTQQHFPFLKGLPHQEAKTLFFEHSLAEHTTFLKEEE